MKRSRRSRISNAALLAITLAVLLGSGCANEQKILEANKATVTQLLVENSELREFLENDIYGLSSYVTIARYSVEAHPEAVIYMDGQLIIPEGYDLEWYKAVKTYEKTIVEVFQVFDCENISLFPPDSTDPNGPKKVLNIVFDDIKINDDAYHAQFLSYSKDGVAEPGTGSDVKVFKDWYYSTPSYM